MKNCKTSKKVLNAALKGIMFSRQTTLAPNKARRDAEYDKNDLRD